MDCLAHFPADSFALANFDGTALYEHADRQGFHQDWGTLIFNYGRNEVRSFLISSALACASAITSTDLADAVASMLYLDYSRKEGEDPQPLWRTRKPRGHRLLRQRGCSSGTPAHS